MAIQQLVRRRETNGITVLFYSHDELIVQAQGVSLIFHCWFSNSRRQSFRPFRKALMYQKALTLEYILGLASAHGVYYVTDNYGKGQKMLRNIQVELASKGRTRNK